MNEMMVSKTIISRDFHTGGVGGNPPLTSLKCAHAPLPTEKIPPVDFLPPNVAVVIAPVPFLF